MTDNKITDLNHFNYPCLHPPPRRAAADTRRARNILLGFCGDKKLLAALFPGPERRASVGGDCGAGSTVETVYTGSFTKDFFSQGAVN